MQLKIISGGQTGADRAALDIAIQLGLCYGGWTPKGGWAEDFPNPPGVLSSYPNLREAESIDPDYRTRLNVRDSDATLILLGSFKNCESSGTDLTCEIANELRRPLLILQADRPNAASLLHNWLFDLENIKTLNIAGPRESQSPGLYAHAVILLEETLSLLMLS